MRIPLITLLMAMVVPVTMSACGGGATPGNTTVVNANAAKENTNNPLETVKSTPDSVKNNAPTLTPVFKAYCAAKIKNDEAALRKIYSEGTIKHFEAEMKQEKIKTLAKYLETDRVTDKLCEASNERITGDRAIVRIQTDGYPNGVDVVFVKENGEWKMTDESPTFQSVKPSNSNAPTGKK